MEVTRLRYKNTINSSAIVFKFLEIPRNLSFLKDDLFIFCSFFQNVPNVVPEAGSLTFKYNENIFYNQEPRDLLSANSTAGLSGRAYPRPT